MRLRKPYKDGVNCGLGLPMARLQGTTVYYGRHDPIPACMPHRDVRWLSLVLGDVDVASASVR